jgi:hypothetical protein
MLVEFFTLAMHLRLLTNFSFGHFDLPLAHPCIASRSNSRISSMIRSSTASAPLRFPSEFSTALTIELCAGFRLPQSPPLSMR